jgi:hypothetical protein
MNLVRNQTGSTRNNPNPRIFFEAICEDCKIAPTFGCHASEKWTLGRAS